MREGFIEFWDGIWYEEATGEPWSSKRKIGIGKWDNNGELKKLKCRNSRGRKCINKNGKSVQWHREVWKFFNKKEIPSNLTIDHISRDHTDNKIENLRLANLSEQAYNCRKQKNCYSDFKGVTFKENIKKWAAYIWVDGKQKTIGYFHIPCERMAAMAYDAYVEKYNIPNCPTNKELGLY